MRAAENDSNSEKRRAAAGKAGGFFANLGPGLITGAADDDPSGISTYSVTGATFGYAQLWTGLFSFPLMAAVQLMCARLRDDVLLNDGDARLGCSERQNEFRARARLAFDADFGVVFVHNLAHDR